jgi:DNA-binding transcriptional LysR family regulator
VDLKQHEYFVRVAELGSFIRDAISLVTSSLRPATLTQQTTLALIQNIARTQLGNS